MTRAEREALADAVIAGASLEHVCRRLFDEKFTGQTIIHWAQGHPRSVEIPRDPVRIVLDSRQKQANT